MGGRRLGQDGTSTRRGEHDEMDRLEFLVEYMPPQYLLISEIEILRIEPQRLCIARSVCATSQSHPPYFRGIMLITVSP